VCTLPAGICIAFFERNAVVHKGIVPLPRIGTVKSLLNQGDDFIITDILPTGEKEMAINSLEKAISLNPKLKKQAAGDNDLESIHSEPKFQE